MAGTFDATFKELLDRYPAEWVRLLRGRLDGEVEVVDADLSTIAPKADKVFRLHEPNPSMFHVEAQASYRTDVPNRVHLYNAIAFYRCNLPVDRVVLLLRPEADGPAMSGVLRRHRPSGEQYLEFRYGVVRLWEIPLEAIMTAGLGVLPLAPLAAGAQQRVQEVVREVHQRLDAEADPSEVGSLQSATFWLMGLRYPLEVIKALFKGVQGMKESVTYQAVLAEGAAQGRIEGARESLLDAGAEQLGPPDEATRAAVEAIQDFERLKRMNRRIPKVATWEELLSEV